MMGAKMTVGETDVIIHALFVCCIEDDYTYPATDLFYCEQAGGFVCDNCLSGEPDWVAGESLYDWLMKSDIRLENLLI